MGEFTKTIIVDLDHDEDPGHYRKTIKAAVGDLGTSGGMVIVEAGVYTIGTGDMIEVPSNTTIIGRGNVEIRVTAPGISVFRNYHFNVTPYYDARIVLSGFKIVVACPSDAYNNHLIWMQNVSDCLIEKITIEAPSDINPYGIKPGSFAILLYSFSSDKYCHSNIIRQCVIREFGATVSSVNKYGYGIGLTRQKDTQYFCCDTIVKNNHVSGCLTSLYCSFAERIIIQGNIFTRNKEMNISFDQVKNTIVKGNQINESDAETGSHGFYPSGCEGLIILGNIVFGNRESGIKPRFGCNTKYDENDNCPLGHEIPDKYYAIIGNVCHKNGYIGNGNGIHLQGLTEYMTIMGNSCVNNNNEGIRLQIEKGSPGLPAAINNIVSGNVAVLHVYDYDRRWDKPISVEDASNIQSNNMTGSL